MGELTPLDRARELLRLLLSHPTGAWAFAFAFFVWGIDGVLADRFLHDEGLLAFMMADWVGQAPLETLFFQKSRPLLALLSAPLAPLGLRGFLVAKVLLATASVPLVASIARHAGLERPNLAALFLTVAPLALETAGAGVTNTDAAFAVVLVTWLLHVRGRVALAGLLAGALLLVRAELALFVAALVFTAPSPRRRLLAMLPVVPLSYGVLGALYHGDALWMLTYPPALTSLNPAGVPAEGLAGDATGLVTALIALAPAGGLALLLRRAELSPIERLALLFVVPFVVFLRGMPLVGALNFDDSPRYLAPAGPFLALLTARVVDAWDRRGEPGPRAPALLVLLLLAGHWLDAASREPVLIACVAFWALAVTLVRLEWPRAALAVAAAGALLTNTSVGAGTRLELSDTHPRIAQVGRWLTDNAPPGAMIVTNVHVLRAYFERDPSLARRSVFYLLGPDQLRELETLTNPANGQRARILQLAMDRGYAPGLRSDTLDPRAIPDGTFFVLADDPRLAGTLDPDRFGPLLVSRFGSANIGVLELVGGEAR